MQNNLVDALKWRYAVQVFDTDKKVSDEDIHSILEAGRLAPSSFGLEPWKFIVVENPEIRAKLKDVSWGQPKITDASHLIVIARRTDARENIVRERIERTMLANGMTDASALDGFKQMMDGSVAMRDDAALDNWNARQVYIPLGTMIAQASLLGVDSGPMEGFDGAKVDEILGLTAKNLTATSILTLGYRGQDSEATRPKVRRSFEDVVEFVR